MKIKIVIKIVLIITIISSVIFAFDKCATCIVTNSNRHDAKEKIYNDCILYIHEAGRSKSLIEYKSNLKQFSLCSDSMKNVCSNSIDNEIKEVNQILLNIDSYDKLSIADEEALIQKYNRILFAGGAACYKGNCKYSQSVFFKCKIPF